MPRLIDADNLWEVLRGEEGAKALNHSPVKLIDIKQIIDNVPTTDAIPVEWLREFDLYYAGISGGTPYMNELIEAWQKEQEARA